MLEIKRRGASEHVRYRLTAYSRFVHSIYEQERPQYFG